MDHRSPPLLRGGDVVERDGERVHARTVATGARFETVWVAPLTQCFSKILLVRGAAFMAQGLDHPHIRFNAAFSEHVQLAQYLGQRLHALVSGCAALDRARL